MNITNHGLKRYVERFKSVPSEDIDADIINNKELYSEELNKMFSFSKLIYTGRFHETNENTNYYLVDNIILVTDLASTKLITLYRVNFGFGRDVDKGILSNLIEQLDEAETEYIKAMDISKENRDDLSYKVLSLEEEISSQRELLKAMEDSLEELKKLKKSITLEEDKSKIVRDKIAKKIVYSNIYKNVMDKY